MPALGLGFGKRRADQRFAWIVPQMLESSQMTFLFTQLSTFLIGGFFSILLLGGGFAVGLWVGRRRVRVVTQAPAAAPRVEALLTRIVDWTQEMADDMSEYRSVVHGVSNLLVERGESMDAPQRRATAGLLAEVVDANERLQRRLNQAEAMLSSRDDEISMYMSEARTDALTGLPNRRAFDEELTRRMAEWHRHGHVVSVVLADVDHFKKFNDSYGHQTGDVVLKNVAAILQETMRESDLVARVGGEEMALILPGCDVNEAGIVAERTRRKIEESRCQHDGIELRVTVSFGTAQCASDEDPGQFMERADQALYAAKRAGRNRTYLHDGYNSIPFSRSPEKPTPSATQATRTHDSLALPFSAETVGPAAVTVVSAVRKHEAAVNQDPVRSFAEVCQDLRQRLDEVARGATESRTAGATGNGAGHHWHS